MIFLIFHDVFHLTFTFISSLFQLLKTIFNHFSFNNTEPDKKHS